jgi:hypothetical protein
VRREYQRERQGLVLSGDGSTGRWDSMYLENVRRRGGEGKEVSRFQILPATSIFLPLQVAIRFSLVLSIFRDSLVDCTRRIPQRTSPFVQREQRPCFLTCEWGTSRLVSELAVR